MQSNIFDNSIFGINITSQGIKGVVEGTHVVVLRHLVSRLTRRLSLHLAALRLAGWRAFTCIPTSATPAMAMCPCYTGCRPRQSVVVTRGAVSGC